MIRKNRRINHVNIFKHQNQSENKTQIKEIKEIKENKEENIVNREESEFLPEFNHFEGNLDFFDFVPNPKYYYYFVSENVIPSKRGMEDRRTKFLGLWDAQDVQRFRYYPGTKNIYTFIGFENENIREEAKNGKRIIYSVLNKIISNYPYEPYETHKTDKTDKVYEIENQNEEEEHEEIEKIESQIEINNTESRNDQEEDDDDDDDEKIIESTEEDDDYFSDDDEVENENENENEKENEKEDDDDFFSDDD